MKKSLLLLVMLGLAGIAAADIAEEWIKNGRAKYEAKDFDGAGADFSQAIAKSPKNAVAYYWRGRAKIKGPADRDGDYSGAVADFTKAISLRSKEAAFYTYRGLAEMKMNADSKALKDFDHAVALDPEYKQAYLLRGFERGTLALMEPSSNYKKGSDDDLNKAAKLKDRKDELN